MSSSQAPSKHAPFPNGAFPPPESLQACNELLSKHPDRIRIKNLCVEATVGQTIFGEQKLQPVRISAVIPTRASISSAAQKDEVNNSTIHYGLMSKEIRLAVQKIATEPKKLDAFTESVASTIQAVISRDGEEHREPFQVTVFLPKASGWGTGIRYHYCYRRGHKVPGRTLHLENLRVHTIIGVNEPEKKVRQPIMVNVWLDPLNKSSVANDYNEVEQIVVKTIEESTFQTLEALSETIVSNLFKLFVFPAAPGSTVRVHVEKPLAVLMAEGPAVEIERKALEEEKFASRIWDECDRVLYDRIPMPFPVGKTLRSHLKRGEEDVRRE